MTKHDIVVLLERLRDHYDEPITEDRIERWERSLEGAETRYIDAAAEQYMAQQPRFFPKPAELITLADEMANAPAARTPLSTRPGKRMRDMTPEAREQFIAESIANYRRRNPDVADRYPGTGLRKFLRQPVTN